MSDDPTPPGSVPGWPELAAEMARQRMSAPELAGRIGVGRQYVNTLLRGDRDPKAETIRNIATVLGVTVKHLGLPVKRVRP